MMTCKPIHRQTQALIDIWLYRHPGQSMEDLSAILECSTSMLRKYSLEPEEDNGSGRSIPARRLERLSLEAKDDIWARGLIHRFQATGLLQDVTVGDPLPDYTGATIEGTDFSGQTLSGVSFKNSKIFHANFNGAILHGADFSGAYLFGGCSFHRAECIYTNFQRCTIDEASFRNADIRAARFRHARFTRCIFQDCFHTGSDLRDVIFLDTHWFADRYRGGLALQGADLRGLIGITESHGVNRWIIQNAADGRQQWKALAGWMEVDSSEPGCWLHLIDYIESAFSDSEQREIYAVLTAEPTWGTHIRIEFEKIKRGMVDHLFQNGRLPARKAVNAELSGRACDLFGVPGQISRGGLFVPDGVEGAGELLTAFRVDNKIDLLTLQAITERGGTIGNPPV